jgi:hypothetical protein
MASREVAFAAGTAAPQQHLHIDEQKIMLPEDKANLFELNAGEIV